MAHQLKIDYMDLDLLREASYNPRTIDKKEFAGLVTSINTFGLIDPILINADNNNTIIGGHQRKRAAQAAGLKEAPVIKLHLSIEAERKLNVILNSQAISGKYDEVKLSELLETFKADDDYFTLRLDALEPLDLSDPDEHGSLEDRFVISPFSILNTMSGTWQKRKKDWLAKIEDKGESRKGVLGDEGGMLGGINDGVSILDAVLAELMVRWFGLPGGQAFDPFAGDSVFGYVAASTGMPFTGIELRQEQVDLNQARVDKDDLPAKYICDDAMNMDKHIKDGSMDFMFSCPPYADLEVYSDLPNDISNMSHEQFFTVYTKVLQNTYKKLKPNRFGVVTISEVRNKKGEYINLVPKTIELMTAAGYTYYNELILVNTPGTLPQRVGRSMRNRKIGRQHQNILVFYKGDIKQIKSTYPELTDLVADEDLNDETEDLAV